MGRNDRDLVDAEGIKKRWKEYMEKLYKKDLKKLDNYDSVVKHSASHRLHPQCLETLPPGPRDGSVRVGAGQN